MTTLRGDDLELRPLPETDLPKLLMIYQGTPLGWAKYLNRPEIAAYLMANGASG